MFQCALGSAYFGADDLKWTPTLFLKKEKVFIAPFKAPILKLLHMEKEAGERETYTESEGDREKGEQKYKTQGNQDHAVQNCYSCFCFYWLFLLASLFQQLWFI